MNDEEPIKVEDFIRASYNNNEKTFWLLATENYDDIMTGVRIELTPEELKILECLLFYSIQDNENLMKETPSKIPYLEKVVPIKKNLLKKLEGFE